MMKTTTNLLLLSVAWPKASAENHLRHEERALLAVPPPNDLCGTAEFVHLDSVTAGSTAAASIYVDPNYCGTSITAPGVWYEFEGNGNRIRVSTCPDDRGSWGYDTKLSVYCHSCSEPYCIDGNDDHDFFGDCFLGSTVEFDSQDGFTYHVLVHGFSSETGDFKLSITDQGDPIGQPVQCAPSYCDPYGGYLGGALKECSLGSQAKGAPGCLACFVKNQQDLKPNEKALESRCINVKAMGKQYLEKKSCNNMKRNDKAACLHSYDVCETCKAASTGTASCAAADSCGGYAGDCFCDTLCVALGDCCWDAVMACNVCGDL